MPELITEKTFTARKVHRCMSCGGPAVQPGERYTRTTYRSEYDHRLYDWVQCPPCLALVVVIWEWEWHSDDGICEDDYQVWASEYRNDPEHGEAARAYLIRTGWTTEELSDGE